MGVRKVPLESWDEHDADLTDDSDGTVVDLLPAVQDWVGRRRRVGKKRLHSTCTHLGTP